jgi:hypothetical protein
MAIGGQEAISTLDAKRDQNKAGSSSSSEPLFVMPAPLAAFRRLS